ncbi:MAG TPA: D-alanine--D-alanine ligase [Sedimentisphaerales bacterium]|nr:D-alanine--D-alanine ligase [Sedimentisphaerales bacterium]HRS11933.1 D-alanine--D-alanine ligase [Sedimentisphaerales bacterium]HRV48610.1 D-alanine--D-alanine ligase [Sedimentisphaerales bacterium]
MKVVVLQGGVGREREVSLQSGRCVAEALREGGMEVIASDITPDDMTVLDRSDIDVFFVALHGEFGEDGRLQQILEDRGLVYTGCGPEASRTAFDKILSKNRFAAAGVVVAPTIEVCHGMSRGGIEAKLKSLGERFVVKPVRQGSSVGVSVVDSPGQAAACALKVREEFGDCMIEPFVRGREITVGVLGRETLPIIEIRSRTGFYDYHAKYVDDRTEYLFDTVTDAQVRARISRDAMACFDALGCRDFARVDFILSDDGVPHALEINTIPGFTTHSLLPKAAARAGLSMSQLCVQIVHASFCRKPVQQNVRMVDSDSICF